VLDDSRLNPNRFNMFYDNYPMIDNNRDLNITEASLNELLTNVSLSLLSLNMWTDVVDVNTTVYRNTYDFSRPLNLVLPYAVCLGFGLVIVVFGLFAMHENGVPVADGGFIQVMMATRGRTEMESLVLKQGLVSPSSISKELKNLKIRYGELVEVSEEGGSGVYGLGTVDETISLGRG